MTPLVAIFCHFTLAITCFSAFPGHVSAADGQKRPAGIPDAAVPFADWNVADISAWRHGDQLYLALHQEFPDDLVIIPRLANVIRSIHWLADADTSLKLQPEPKTWIITAAPTSQTPAAKDADHILVLNLDAEARLFNEELVSEASPNGIVLLPAKHALTHGDTLRFEPQPHKNTVGYWSNEKDFAEWHYTLHTAGRYDIEILQGCGKGHGGSHVDIRIESHELNFDVQETGHFQNFIWRTIGTVELKTTEHGSLQLVPAHKAAGAVMDVRAIRLVPVGTERSFEAELADPAALPAAK